MAVKAAKELTYRLRIISGVKLRCDRCFNFKPTKFVSSTFQKLKGKDKNIKPGLSGMLLCKLCDKKANKKVKKCAPIT